jgi:hypothetical protein
MKEKLSVRMQIDKILINVLATFTLCVVLFLFLPLTVYSLNIYSVTVHLQTLLHGGAFIGIITAVVLFLLSCLPVVNRVLGPVYQVLAVIIFVLVVFPNQTGELAGFEKNTTVVEWLPYVKLIGLVILISLLAWWRPKQLQFFVFIVFLMATLVSGYILTFQRKSIDKGTIDEQFSRDYATSLGNEKNIIVIVPDSFTGYRMIEVFDDRPDLKSSFLGFTIYPRALASALNTPAGISAILTGDLEIAINVDNGLERNTQSLSQSFLQDAIRKDFDSVFVSKWRSDQTDISTYIFNDFVIPQDSENINSVYEYLYFWGVSLSRILPKSMYDFSNQFLQGKLANKSLYLPDYEQYSRIPSEHKIYFQAKLVLDYFINNLHIGNSSRKALLLHSYISHPPFVFDENGRYAPHSNAGTSIFTTKMLSRLLEKIKQLGVYNSSLIIVVADHGGMGIRDRTMGGVFEGSDRLEVIFNPLLMVKPPNATQTLHKSEMSVWLGDVYETVRDYLGFEPNEDHEFPCISLLQPAQDVTRILELPLFIRPDQISYSSALGNWVRKDGRGQFVDFGSVSGENLLNRLRPGANIMLFAGVDKLMTHFAEKGWIASKGILYRAAIEVDQMLATKINSSGIVAITKRGGTFKKFQFQDITEGARFIQEIPPGTPLLAVGLHLPIAAVKNLFPSAKKSFVDNQVLTNFVYASGVGFDDKSLLDIGTDDISIEFVWE